MPLARGVVKPLLLRGQLVVLEAFLAAVVVVAVEEEVKMVVGW